MLLSALTICGVPRLVVAQSAEPSPRFQIGSFGLTPVISLTGARDNNVIFEAEDRVTDLTATVSPGLSATLRSPRFRLLSQNQIDAVYYKELTDYRAVDFTNSARADVPLARLTPYVSGTRMLTQNRRDLEIDARVRRLEQTWSVGTDFGVTPKLTVGLGMSRSRTRYDGDVTYLGSDLDDLLNRTTAGEQVAIRYAITPLTTIGVDVNRARDRFVSTPLRDSNSLGIGPVVEFRPDAIINGRAQVGFRRRTFLNQQVPDFQGTFVQLGLGYVLLGRTRFNVDALRDVYYTYLASEAQYLVAGATATVTHVLVEPWEVHGRVGRYRFTYDVGGTADPGETFGSYGGGLGYRIGRTRIGFQIDHERRKSVVSTRRHYDRTLLTTSITHAF